jgi:ectoine hydroxylase-related dioxygenase (phytanoyl-CoA dioxygenase family)
MMQSAGAREVQIAVTPGERLAGALDPPRRAAALEALRQEGYVVLLDVIDPAHVASLRERMLSDLALILARPDKPFNWNPGNVQQEPPPFPPYLFRDVLLNDVVIDVTRAILGPGLKNLFYSGNTALPGVGQRQPVHVDEGQLWPDLEVAPPPHALVISVPVVDMSPDNGSTEIWPGTHRDTTVCLHERDIKVPEAKVEARRKVRPPVQPCVRAGGVMIRDIRIWHAGMPNRSAQPRPLIQMVHAIWWNTKVINDEPPTFPKGTEAFFKHPHLATEARFVEGPIDHIHRSKAYEYTGANR